jgi:hypothetical protein
MEIMKTLWKPILIGGLFMIIGNISDAQKVKLGEVIIISTPTLKNDVKPEALRTFFSKEVYSDWKKSAPGTGMYLLQADRGTDENKYIMACVAEDPAAREGSLPPGSPFSNETFSSVGSLTSDPSDFFTEPEKYTEYRLIGAEKVGRLPEAGILGIHLIQIRKEKSDAFEVFVQEELHPALTHLFPDMKLFYYKAVAGENAGSYILLFAIESVQTREKYWPTGGPETEAVKKAFQPLKDLAKKLSTFQVKGTYLLPESGGAAAIFESLNWTDYVLVN